MATARCGDGVSAGDPVGCSGIAVPGSTKCLAHANSAEQTAYVTSLAPGDDLDLRSTAVAQGLLDQILTQVTDPATGHPRIGTAWFDAATFLGDARFDAATFVGDARFDSVTFTGHAWFDSTVFTSDAWFDSAAFTGDGRFDSVTFTGDAWFDSTVFMGEARFDSVVFRGDAWFESAAFTGDAVFDSAAFRGEAWFDAVRFGQDAWFDAASFAGDARFEAAVFAEDAWFRSVSFEHASSLGPLVCGDVLDLSAASFGAAVTLEVAARRLVCRLTRWSDMATLRIRYAETDLSDAVFEHPLGVTGRRRPFSVGSAAVLDESVLAGLPVQARLTSLQGVDAAHLLLTDLDLSDCLFSGTIHLDELRMTGHCPFHPTPVGLRWHGGTPVRHTHRSTLVEEHYWRRTRDRAAVGWLAAPPGVEVVQPAALAAVYRALRKSYEDSSNEPGAADFYYGEMEMRRADPATDPAERGLLTVYWALSGYGLRAARALGWFFAAATLTVVVMMLWGVPKEAGRSHSTGTVSGGHISMSIEGSKPVNPSGPVGARLTSDRFDRSLRVVVNSVIFRSSGQDLTTTGTYAEMASRLTEPVLLGLTALAVQGRIKR